MLDERDIGQSSGKTWMDGLPCEAGILSVSPCMRIEEVLRILCPFITRPLVDKS